MKVLAHITAFFKDEEGASGIEYALIAGMAAVVLATSSTSIKASITTIMTTVSTKLAEVAKP